MSLIDTYQQETLQQILAQEWEDDNRAVWEDGTPVQTKRIFGVVNRYDLSKEFPAPTLRPVPLKTCFREVDWIYRKRSNNVNDFNGKIWDAWANPKTKIRLTKTFPFVEVSKKGSIGRAYGYQVAKPVGQYGNQMDYILEEIKKNPTSRRLVIELFNVEDTKFMNLPPCAHHLQFVIKSGKANLILKQRSQDHVVANSFNVVEYALLLIMVARHTGYQVGELVHIIGDCHIYNKHEKQAMELVSRVPYEAPTLWVNPDVVNFYDFTEEDFRLENYQKHGQLKMAVAI